ncbi:MAG: hypothetical protein J6K21_02925 [Bacilli bacterium]|nr:hypothetical protein [Bacilli bacterium]
MKEIDEAVNQAVASLNIDNLEVTEQQTETIKEKLKKISNDHSLIEELLKISEESEKIKQHERK